MKFSSLLSVAVFTAVLAWTWNVIHSQGSIPFETHAGIQDSLSQIIVNTVKAKRPSASEVNVEKIWTESTRGGKIKAHFLYSFKDMTNEGAVNSQIQGYADLERTGLDGSGADHWVVAKVKTNSDAIVFEEGLTITPGATPESASKPDTKNETKSEH